MRWIPEQTEHTRVRATPPALKHVVFALTYLVFAAFIIGIFVVSPVLAVLIGAIIIGGNLFNWS
jgi:uncharacterized membrane protein